MYPFSLNSPKLPRAISNVSRFVYLPVISHTTGDMMSPLSLAMHLMVGRYGALESAIASIPTYASVSDDGPKRKTHQKQEMKASQRLRLGKIDYAEIVLIVGG
jgi:hypothetical protein